MASSILNRIFLVSILLFCSKITLAQIDSLNLISIIDVSISIQSEGKIKSNITYPQIKNNYCSSLGQKLFNSEKWNCVLIDSTNNQIKSHYNKYINYLLSDLVENFYVESEIHYNRNGFLSVQTSIYQVDDPYTIDFLFLNFDIYQAKNLTTKNIIKKDSLSVFNKLLYLKVREKLEETGGFISFNQVKPILDANAEIGYLNNWYLKNTEIYFLINTGFSFYPRLTISMNINDNKNLFSEDFLIFFNFN
ncbi:MAG: hypothetical protein ACPGVD_09215 [Flavobacteriales bacterium]